MASKLRNELGAYISAVNLADDVIQKEGATIGTAAGATDTYVTATVGGVLSAAQFASLAALIASDTNYITFTITNLGQTGAGTAVMLAVDPANTTKATGGAALTANARKNLTVHATAANLVVAKGDRLKITATVTGTLPNTVTVPIYTLTFRRTS